MEGEKVIRRIVEVREVRGKQSVGWVNVNKRMRGSIDKSIRD